MGIPKTGIETETAAPWPLETKNDFLRQIPVGRLGIPEKRLREPPSSSAGRGELPGGMVLDVTGG